MMETAGNEKTPILASISYFMYLTVSQAAEGYQAPVEVVLKSYIVCRVLPHEAKRYYFQSFYEGFGDTRDSFTDTFERGLNGDVACDIDFFLPKRVGI